MGIFDEMYDPQVIAPRFDFISSQAEARMRALELEKEVMKSKLCRWVKRIIDQRGVDPSEVADLQI